MEIKGVVEGYNIYKDDVKDNRKIMYRVVKRGFDILVSSVALVLLLPVFLILAVLIKLDSKGPVFFLHKRIGKNGKEIKIYKFRTMVQNAEELLKRFTPEQKKEYEENYKLDNDFRITKIGNILRKTSLDELPQLINILKGDMSIVGPGPLVKDELEKYGENLYNLVEGGNIIASDANVRQGLLETSNVNIVNEMVNMIAIQRAYEAGQRVITSVDSTLGITVNLGKVQ